MDDDRVANEFVTVDAQKVSIQVDEAYRNDGPDARCKLFKRDVFNPILIGISFKAIKLIVLFLGFNPKDANIGHKTFCNDIKGITSQYMKTHRNIIHHLFKTISFEGAII